MTMMDQAERSRFLETLRADPEFRDIVRRELLTQELLDLPEVVRGLAASVAEQTRQIEAHNRRLEALELQVLALLDAVAHQRQDIAALTNLTRQFMEQTTSAIEGLITTVRDLASLVREGFAGLRDELRGEIIKLRDDTTNGFTAVNARIDQVQAEVSEIKRRLAS